MARRWQDRCAAFIKTATEEYRSFERARLPTVRELARRFRVRQVEVCDWMDMFDNVVMFTGTREMPMGVITGLPRAEWSFKWEDE
jgi:hypothetical protein